MRISLVGSSGKVAKQIIMSAFLLNKSENLELILKTGNPALVNSFIFDIKCIEAFLPGERIEPSYKITDDYSDISESDYIFICAGLFMNECTKEKYRTIDPTGRLAHTIESLDLIYEIGEKIREYCPDTTVIVITNQSDIMAQIMRTILGSQKVFGFGGILDEMRFKKLLASSLNKMSSQSKVLAHDIHLEIIGYHSNDMLLVKSSIEVPKRFQPYMDNAGFLDDILNQTKSYGREISRIRDTRHPTVHFGASIAPGFACWNCIAALTGQRNGFRASFNTQLSNTQKKYYDTGVTSSLSVPLHISEKGFSEIKGALCSSSEKKQLRDAIAQMEENLNRLSNLRSRNIF